MQGWTYTEIGSPSNLTLSTDLPIPTASSGELLVRLSAGAINPVDYKVLGGMPFAPPKDDKGRTVIGWDGSGVVESVGDGVTGFAKGDTVYFAGNVIKSGTYAQYAVVDARIAAKKPESIGHEDAAALPLTALTAWEGITECAAFPESGNGDKSILILGGAGGVGSIAIQLAKHVFGFGKVIASASRPETIEHCKSLGADVVINHRNSLKDEFEAAKLELADLIYVTVDLEKHITAIGDVIKPLGTIVTITFGAPIDLMPLFVKRAKIAVEIMFSRAILNDSPEKQGEILAKVAAAVDAGKIKSTRSKTYKWSEVPTALEFQASGKSIGKNVYKID